MKAVIWSIKDIIEILQKRQKNEFDGNLAVSGNRGDGKTTFIGKIFFRLPKFNPWKQQVYQREDILKLLKYHKLGQCWDDEAINSGYKRDFHNKAQQEQIKILTNYRDNFNIFASAIPNFFSLDKDLRDLYFLHIHIIERGIAIVHMPLQGKLYSQDRWDAKYNAKVETNWSKKMQKNPDFKPPYHRLTTFRGYLYFNDLTTKQKALVQEVKRVKRAKRYESEGERDSEVPFIEKIYKRVIEKKLTKDFLLQLCLMEGKKYSSITSSLNIMLKDNGHSETLNHFFVKEETNAIHTKNSVQINSLVPHIPQSST